VHSIPAIVKDFKKDLANDDSNHVKIPSESVIFVYINKP